MGQIKNIKLHIVTDIKVNCLNMLLDFPFEIQEHILRYCNVADLINLACCSTAYYTDTIKKILWKCIKLSGNQVLHADLCDVKHMLKYTKTLLIFNPALLENDMPEMLDVDTNYEAILECSNPTVLHANMVPKNAFTALCKLQDLLELRMGGLRYIHDSVLQNICRSLTELKVFELNNSKFGSLTDKGFLYLNKLTSLTELVLNECPVTDLRLSSMIALQKLSLKRCSNFTNESLSHLKNLVYLRELCLENCKQISNLDVSNISTLIKLEKLSLSGCPKLSDEGISHLKHLVMLRELSLSSSGITDLGVSVISTLHRLEKLDICNCNEVSDIGLSYICKLSMLKELDITTVSDKYSGVGISHLSKLTKLEQFRAGCCRRIKRGFSHLKKLKSLKNLDVWLCGLADDNLHHIGKITSLQALNLLHNRGITDAGMSLLTSLTSLRYLNVAGTQVTDSGISKLYLLENLKTVDVKGFLMSA